MIEEVRFKDTDMSVNVTIDNESKELPIKEIIKLPTFIKLNQSLNTAYHDDIVVDLSLYYINEDGEEKPLNIDGNIIASFSNESIIAWRNRSNNLSCKETIVPLNDNIMWLDENNQPVHTDAIKAVVKECTAEDIYIEEYTIPFKKGRTRALFRNNIPIGEYVFLFEYMGNKYFEETYYESTFTINKRQAICVFDEEVKSNYPREDIAFNGILKDAKTDKRLSNVPLNFNFHGARYLTGTNENGEFTIFVTLPDADISHCALFMNEDDFSPIEHWMEYLSNSDTQYIDEDGNIRKKDLLYGDIVEFNNVIPEGTSEDINTYISDTGDKSLSKTTYPIDVYFPDSPDNSYYLINTRVHADVKKIPTSLTLGTTNCNDTSNIIQINGGVTTEDNNVHYGRVVVEFPEANYTHTPASVVDYDGSFNATIDLKTIYNIYNNNTNSTLEVYQAADEKDTEVILSGDTKVNVGETFIIEATIKSIDSSIVKDGMIVFIIKDREDSNNIIYKYATELDNTGTAILAFNTSKKANYFIQAKYYGMFGYTNSVSSMYEIGVI